MHARIRMLVVIVLGAFAGCGDAASEPPSSSDDAAELTAGTESAEAQSVAGVSEADVEIVPSGNEDGKVHASEEITVKGRVRVPQGHELESEDLTLNIFDNRGVTHDSGGAKLEQQPDGSYTFETTLTSPRQTGTFSLESFYEGNKIASSTLVVE